MEDLTEDDFDGREGAVCAMLIEVVATGCEFCATVVEGTAAGRWAQGIVAKITR